VFCSLEEGFMAYTVKQLAQISGVTIRTLHHYDEIGLLKPAYYGENQYRYYEEEQLLVLQQILFFRALNFSLSDIQCILSSSNFHKLNALESHKTLLEQELLQRKKLLKTLEKTISHLNGELKMQDKEFYYGFDLEKQKAHEKYLVDNKIVSQEMLDECNEKTKN
jgi:MerR family transcriptional regulator, thiopeptide resistance regulator